MNKRGREMSLGSFDFVLSIGGAAGQGIATPGDILARIFARRGLHLYTYNAFQSIIRGGHIFLTMRISNQEMHSHGDKLDLLLCLNQDTMDRHLRLMGPGSRVLYNGDSISPGEHKEGVNLCPLPIGEITGNTRATLAQNTVALGGVIALLDMDFQILEDSIRLRFQRQGQEIVDQNISVARAGFDHATSNFEPYDNPVPTGTRPLAFWSGNDAMAMGAAAAGLKFYAAYPMSPSTGILHWMAQNARDLGIMVRQVEDEIAVANMVVGAAHAGTRAMCATSGGGFALMTEAIGAASMMEIPAVFVNVQRAGPSTGVPTKTEQGDLWQALGASQGDFERFIVAPRDALDSYNTMPELFNLTDQSQCPGIVLSDLLVGEGHFTIDPNLIDLHPDINRGELITEAKESSSYKRYSDTETGVSPRAQPGLEGYVHIVATDEHDEDSMLLSDEFTNPVKRRKMVEKRARKFSDIAKTIAPPELEGSLAAEVTLVGWGSTHGVITEAIELLRMEGIIANQLSIKWIVPFHSDEVTEILSNAKRVIIVENNYSGQFARYLRSETGIKASAHIRKYDGEPFMPHHIVNGIKEILAEATDHYIPAHEITV
jgi:2-oxoglutarate ferredoxin oxidoreductase subunit alpha